MAITMLKLCEDAKSKYDMELVAGKNGIENTVRWVHMVEDREVPRLSARRRAYLYNGYRPYRK